MFLRSARGDTIPYRCTYLKGTVPREFPLQVFHEKFPQNSEYPIRPISNFLEVTEILAAQGAPSVKFFVWTPLGKKVNK